MTQFPPSLPGETTLGLYTRIYEQIPPHRNEAYVSSPLTSGGAIKIHRDNAALTPAEAKLASLKDNGRFAETVFDRAGHLFSEEQITLPHKIGYREGWTEYDYNSFWLAYISGIAPAAATEFLNSVHKMGVDVQTFNTHPDRAVKQQEYSALLNAYLHFINTQGPDLNPVSRVALLPDHQESLGCSLERDLAHSLNIPKDEIHFDTDHPGFGQLAQAAPWLHLVNGTTSAGGKNIAIFRNH